MSDMNGSFFSFGAKLVQGGRRAKRISVFLMHGVSKGLILFVFCRILGGRFFDGNGFILLYSEKFILGRTLESLCTG